MNKGRRHYWICVACGSPVTPENAKGCGYCHHKKETSLGHVECTCNGYNCMQARDLDTKIRFKKSDPVDPEILGDHPKRSCLERGLYQPGEG